MLDCSLLCCGDYRAPPTVQVSFFVRETGRRCVCVVVALIILHWVLNNLSLSMYMCDICTPLSLLFRSQFYNSRLLTTTQGVCARTSTIGVYLLGE